MHPAPMISSALLQIAITYEASFYESLSRLSRKLLLGMIGGYPGKNPLVAPQVGIVFESV